MFEELDVVRLTHPLPDAGLPAGKRGTVVAVFGDHEEYEVEFLEGERTLALVLLRPDSLAPIAHAAESASARAR